MSGICPCPVSQPERRRRETWFRACLIIEMQQASIMSWSELEGGLSCLYTGTRGGTHQQPAYRLSTRARSATRRATCCKAVCGWPWKFPAYCGKAEKSRLFLISLQTTIPGYI